jgi:hypothetical protein
MNKRADISQTVIIASMFVLASVAPIFSATPKLNIKLKNGSEVEQRKKDQIERLAQQYDLKKYTKTRDIIIEQGARPHSSPVLTLGAGLLNYDDGALATYIHEQGHWVLMERLPRVNRELLADLYTVAPGLPIDYPQGSGSEVDTYYHLAVCMLEWQGMEELVGAERARKAIDFMKNDHYTAIYGAVIDHRDELEKILKRHGVKF